MTLYQSPFDSPTGSHFFRFKYDSPQESNEVFDSGGESKYLGQVRFEFGPTGHFLSSPLFGCQPHNSLQ